MDHQTTKSKSKMKKFIIIVLILAAGAGSYGYYLYNKPRTGVSELTAAYSLDAKKIFKEYNADENAANTKFLGKVVEVSGAVRSVDIDDRGTMNIAIETGEMGAVNCQFEKKDKMPSVVVGNQVNVKGICSGFLLDIVLVDCELVPEKNS
jgi:hypothetical protein